MKNFTNLGLIVLAIAVAILYFLHFNAQKSPQPVSIVDSDSTGVVKHGLIAYFEMDSLEQQYQYIKEVRETLKNKEQAIANELTNMRNGYMKRIQQLQQKAPTMSQQEGEAAQAEINQMEKNLQQKEARLAQDLQEQQFKLMQDINKRIEEFLIGFNADQRYSYIFSRQAGDFIYYKDTLNDITSEVIKGLNEQYKAAKATTEKKKAN